MSDFAYPELPTFISAKNFPFCSLPYTYTHTHQIFHKPENIGVLKKKNASWSMMIFMVVSCLKLGLDTIDCGPPGSSVHRILQTRVLEWVAIPFSRGSSLLRDNQESKWKRLKLEDPYLKPHRKQSTNNVLKLKGKS